jgi:hypothetical protein
MKNPTTLLILCLTISFVVTDKTCPIYTCDKTRTDKVCANAVAAADHNNVALANVCTANTEFCNVTPGPAYSTLATLTTTATFSCAPVVPTPPITPGSRYPGEECTVDADCYKTGDVGQGSCLGDTVKTCTAITAGLPCTKHESCLKGFYCEADKTCKKQKPQDSPCGTSYECVNNLLCNWGYCNTTPYSLEIGIALDPKDKMNVHKCKYGFTAQLDASSPIVCSSYAYLKAPDADGFVECTLNSKCDYVDLFFHQPLQKDCACGYNGNGKGYCPVPIKSRDTAYADFFNKKIGMFSADCHTMSRDNCYKFDTTDLKKTVNNLGTEHVFKDALDCAKAVFGASSYTTVSGMMIALLVSLLF